MYEKYFMFRFAVSYVTTVFVKNIQLLFVNHITPD